MLHVKLVPVEDSLGIILPMSVLDAWQVTVGDALQITHTPQGLCLHPTPRAETPPTPSIEEQIEDLKTARDQLQRYSLSVGLFEL